MPSRPITATEQTLWDCANEARSRAYAPYSDFTVGAALVSADGRVFTAGNIENASYGLTICAERSAVVRAHAEGATTFTTIAVACPETAITASPCGACRQVLHEFGAEMVVVYRRDGELVAEVISDLLPAGFRLRES